MVVLCFEWTQADLLLRFSDPHVNVLEDIVCCKRIDCKQSTHQLFQTYACSWSLILIEMLHSFYSMQQLC